MSTSLYWAPVPSKPAERSLYDLKNILAKKVWGQDDPYACVDSRIVDDTLIPYLDGIIDANDNSTGKCAYTLKQAILHHGRVELTIHS